MLTVVDRTTERRLALLKQLRIEPVSDGRRLQAEHAAKREQAGAKRSLRHRHEPVGRENLVAAARPALLPDVEEGFAMEHQHPRA